ncbi:MAG: hypothetical protein ABJN22_14125 [Litorimonas sp.]
MILPRLFPLLAIFAMTACQTTPKAKAAKLAIEPDAEQILAIKTAVKSAMGRSDLDMDPGRLVDTSILRVLPVAVEGLADRVPGRPTNFTLMSAGTSCYLLEAGGGMRVELPDMPCR